MNHPLGRVARMGGYTAAAHRAIKRIGVHTTSWLRSRIADYWYWWLLIIACITLRFVVLTSRSQRALGLAVLLLGVLVFVQLLLNEIWAALATEGRDSWQEITAKTYTEGFRQAAATFIGVPGIILGLLAAFSKPPFPLALKVAASSLVFSLIASISLFNASSLHVPVAMGALRFLNYLINAIIWSLAFGLLCITTMLLVGS